MILPIALAALRLLAGLQNIRVIAFRGETDDATNRFLRSAKVFGYQFQEIDLSQYGRTTEEVPDIVKTNYLRNYLQSLDEDEPNYVLVVDCHSSILLARPLDLLDKASNIGSDIILIEEDKHLGYSQSEAQLLLKGTFAKTELLKLVMAKAKDAKDISRSLVTIQEERRLNSLGNYIARAWSPETGCQICDEDTLDLSLLPKSMYPIIQMSIFVARPTPFLDRFFQRIAALTYPKDRIHLITHCPVRGQKKYVDTFLQKHASQYRSVEELDGDKYYQLNSGFTLATTKCLEKEECWYFFLVESTAQFTEPEAIERLVSTNRGIVAPMMRRRGLYWSTFWGAVHANGSYERSDDYFDIVEGRKIGLWNVPLVGTTWLASRWALMQIRGAENEENYLYSSIASAAVSKNIFMHVDNRFDYGYLTNPNSFTLDHLHNDLWQIFDNPLDWEEIYIHPEYHQWARKEVKMGDFEQPCSDVFWVPLMSEVFCKQLIEEMEHYGKWSDGSNYDPRLEGGYENVPTRDIHMRQIDWEDHWIHVLRKYVYPLQLKLFEGYWDKVGAFQLQLRVLDLPKSVLRLLPLIFFVLLQPWARMNFVVRYQQGEQPLLRYHHDASSYTLDMALNRVHIDYQGGGVRFKRYNCTLVDTRVGWPLIFPGRLTHLHEGLEVTSGIRYIFVTFVNP
ncbi:unnamed protein product [Schistocephalus solidus]|uniref:procollagen-lysine 5-dioxygenase n=2 Tax=Schistocephalus solidus TaxID=70667 RepID=A0A183SMH0_SCHSO|nr:unnamed protein product [Schistocephalus solidus]